MNSLSWLLYAIDVIGNLRGLVSISLVLSCIVFGVGCICLAICWPDSTTPEDKEKVATIWRCIRWLIPVIIITALIGVFLPSKNTLYAIAASEVGEKVVQSETVKGLTSDATKALHQWIKTQIEPKKPKE